MSGCADVYASTAREILDLGMSGRASGVLKQALESTAEDSTGDERAWALREAFDGIIGLAAAKPWFIDV